MENKSKGKKLNKKQRAAIEREELTAKLLEKYVEGDSNFQYDPLELDELWKIAFAISREEKEKALGRPLSFISKEEWLERELVKIESGKTKIPTHKVQDPTARIFKYRQKFVETAKGINPAIIGDLKELVPYFNNLFEIENKKEYYDVFDELKYKLVNHWRIDPIYTNASITEFDQKYLWGIIKSAFDLSAIRNSFYNPEISFNLPDFASRLIEENEYKIESLTKAIKNAFEKTAVNQDLILSDFFKLQMKIYQWAEKYHLQKDWLLGYAYYFIYQFANNSELETEDVEVGIKSHNYARTLYAPFEFTAKGWWAEGETADEYRTRTNSEFQERLSQYIGAASVDLELDKLPKLTKPPTFNCIKWLIYMTVKDWSVENVLEKFFPEIAADKNKNDLSFLTFENKIKHIKSEIRRLNQFDLPMPKNL